MRDSFAQLEGEKLAIVQCQHHEEHQEQVNARMQINASQVPPRNWAVDGLADHPRQGGQLKAARKSQDEQPVAPRPVSPGVSEHAADKLGAERRVVRLPIFHWPKVGNRLARGAELVKRLHCLWLAGWDRAHSPSLGVSALPVGSVDSSAVRV